MNNRTIDELKVAVKHAADIGDADALLQCALECEALATTEALALAAMARGSVERIHGHLAAAIENAQRALELYLSIDDKRTVAELNSRIAVLLDTSGDFGTALIYCRRALELHESLNDKSAIAGDYINLTSIAYQTGDYVLALEYCHRALSLYEDMGNTGGVARCLVNIGSTYDGISDYPTALQYFYRALDLMQQIGDLSSVALITTNIGIVHKNIGNFTLSLEHHQRALKMQEDMGDRHGFAFSINSIGSMYLHSGDHAEALKYFRRGLTLNEENGEGAAIIRSMANITNTLICLGEIDEADNILSTLVTMHLPHAGTVINCIVYRAMIQQHRGQLDQAMETFGKALQMAREHNYVGSLESIHEYMRDLCQQRNDFAGYIEHNNEYNRITNEINGKDTAAKLALLEAEQKMAKERADHEKQIAVLHSTLPKHIADRVSRGEQVNDHYDNAAVIFLDIVDFTTISEQLTSDQVVQLLDQIFTALDAVCEKHDVVKIKTIGDSYVAVAFPRSSPSARNDSSTLRASSEEDVIPSEARNVAMRAASAALDMLHAATRVEIPERSPEGSPERSHVSVRLGVHSGALTAGVIGTTRLQYDVWGDTVNTASRLEATGEPGRIHISEAMANVIAPLELERGGAVGAGVRYRGQTELKGKGTMTTYWLEGVK